MQKVRGSAALHVTDQKKLFDPIPVPWLSSASIMVDRDGVRRKQDSMCAAGLTQRRNTAKKA